MKKFMTRKHTEEHLSSRKERFSDLMGKGLFLLAFSSHYCPLKMDKVKN